jgi:magnesium chelatase family protein
VPIATLSRASNRRGETSAEVCAAVTRCRHLQIERQQCLNRDLSGAALGRLCALDGAGQRLLAQASERLHLSARSFHRALRVARTIADLDEQQQLSTQHLAEAIGYRQFNQSDT